MQRRFSIVDVLLRSGDIRDRSVKSSEITPKKARFSAPKFLGNNPQILDVVFKIASISDHAAKFCGDRPRDRGDLALNKKRKKERKKETAAKHYIFYPISIEFTTLRVRPTTEKELALRLRVGDQHQDRAIQDQLHVFQSQDRLKTKKKTKIMPACRFQLLTKVSMGTELGFVS